LPTPTAVFSDVRGPTRGNGSRLDAMRGQPSTPSFSVAAAGTRTGPRPRSGSLSRDRPAKPIVGAAGLWDDVTARSSNRFAPPVIKKHRPSCFGRPGRAEERSKVTLTAKKPVRPEDHRNVVHACTNTLALKNIPGTLSFLWSGTSRITGLRLPSPAKAKRSGREAERPPPLLADEFTTAVSPVILRGHTTSRLESPARHFEPGNLCAS
jgi:hypothetical protein